MQKTLPFSCSCSVGLLGTRALDPKATGGGITRPEEILQTKKREHAKDDHSSLENASTSPQNVAPACHNRSLLIKGVLGVH